MNIQEILSNLKIEQLNAMQQASLSAAGEGKDVILLSPTGTGKHWLICFLWSRF